MKGMRNIWGILLLLITLTATAQEEVQRQGCRRGAPRTYQGPMLRSSQTREPGGDFYLGERHQLTVLVSFGDRSFEGDETETMEKWSGIMNTVDYQEDPYQGSVHDYFYAQSYGKFDLTFDLQYVQPRGKPHDMPATIMMTRTHNISSMTLWMCYWSVTLTGVCMTGMVTAMLISC